MAITASFAADFSAFSSEVKKAEGDLAHFEGSTAQTGTAIAGLGSVSTTTAGPVNSLSTSFRQFDGVLGAVGIHLGPAVKGLEDLGQASGKTTSELGLLGVAGLTVGAAMGGWQIGRAIAEFLDLDQTIANATATLLGWGDVAGQTTAARHDVLARASATAGRAVTDLTEAMRINQAAYDASQKTAADAAKVHEAYATATEEVRIATQNWHWELRQLNPRVVESAKAALDAGVAQKTVATAYELNARQIAAVASSLAAEKQALKEEQAALKESAAEHARVTAELEKHWAAVDAKRDEVFGTDAINQAQQWIEAIATMGGSLDAFTNTQLAALKAGMLAALDAMARTGTLTNAQSSAFAAMALSADQALAALQPVVAVTDDLARAEYDLAVAQDQATAAMQKQGAAATTTTAQMQAAGFQFAGGNVPTAASLTAAAMRPGSMLGFGRGEMIQSILPSVANMPWAGPGGGVTMQSGAVVVNYPIMNDPGALDQIGRLVGDAILQRTTRTGTIV